MVDDSVSVAEYWKDSACVKVCPSVVEAVFCRRQYGEINSDVGKNQKAFNYVGQFYFAEVHREKEKEECYPSAACVRKFQRGYVCFLRRGKNLKKVADVVDQNSKAA